MTTTVRFALFAAADGAFVLFGHFALGLAAGFAGFGHRFVEALADGVHEAALVAVGTGGLADDALGELRAVLLLFGGEENGAGETNAETDDET
jgi:hypothetical protein